MRYKNRRLHVYRSKSRSSLVYMLKPIPIKTKPSILVVTIITQTLLSTWAGTPRRFFTMSGYNNDDNNYTWSQQTGYAGAQSSRYYYYPTPSSSRQNSTDHSMPGSMRMATPQEDAHHQGWDVEARAGRLVSFATFMPAQLHQGDNKSSYDGVLLC